jgi:hypothetical protein
MLLKIGDPASASKLVAFVGDDDEELARTRAPAVDRVLAEREEESLLLGDPALAPRLPGGVARLLAELDTTDDRFLPSDVGLVGDPRVLEWLHRERERRRFHLPSVLGALVLAGDRSAREELSSMIRCGRHRLLYGSFDDVRVFTLDWDFTTLPHWLEELDSNCCRVAGGLESLFEDVLGGSSLYGRPHTAPGEPRSRRARIELLRDGGRFVWSPLVDHFVAAPD